MAEQQHYPLGARLLHWPARLAMRLLGWQIEKPVPIEKLDKYVLVGAPHTSNWDTIFLILCALSLKIQPRMLIKDSWVRGPLGPVVQAFGGVPIDREHSTDMMGDIIALFKQYDHFAMTIAPEGTRSKVSYWKAGFYEIAEQAGVPIVLGYPDYARRVVCFGAIIEPSGDIAADMAIIRDFYADVTPKFPEQASPVRLRPYVIRNREAGKDSERVLERARRMKAAQDAANAAQDEVQ